jgi:hydroxyacyl-ACP dehydratase HTD2-like protein with hotdog domain
MSWYPSLDLVGRIWADGNLQFEARIEMINGLALVGVIGELSS